jgi:two-component system response regulator HydG
MAEVVEQAEQVAASDTTVLLQGESGTGKELLARRIHAKSDRRFGPLVPVNCGALAGSLLESELFGHERGAFTGAVARRKGKVELAHDGTLFLDEVGDVPEKMQMDLLRVLETKQLVRVGGNQPVAVDFRLVAATNKVLEDEIAAGRFREDLYYRINVFRIRVPPLRERRADIPILAEAFIGRFNEKMNRRIQGLTDDAVEALCSYSWPGNVRELQNAIERAVVVCRGHRIDAEHFPFAVNQAQQDELSLAAVEEQHVRKVLAMTGNNVARTARILGIDRVTLYNKLKKYGIRRP